MAKEHASDLEFERNRQEILKMAQKASLNKVTENRSADERNELLSGDKKSVWEYEIIEHRKKKNKDKFMMFGATCGLISLIISIFTLANQVYNFI